MTYRNRKLLDLAHRVNECQLQLDGICEGYSPDGCEPAHSNWLIHGKGGSTKADDVYHCAACHSCHFQLDQGTIFNKAEKLEYWRRGFERTMLLYFANGWLSVK